MHHRLLPVAIIVGLPIGAAAQPVAFHDLGQSNVWAASTDGSRVVGTQGGTQAFQWAVSSGIMPLPGPGGGQLGGDPFAVSADNSTIVGTAWGPTRAFKVTQAGYESLGTPNGAFYQDVRAVAVSTTGTVVLCSTRNGGGEYQVFLHTVPGGYQPISALSPSFLWAHAMTPDAATVVGATNGAFRWTAATGVQSIQGPWNGVTFLNAYGISDDGLVLVGQGRSAGGPEHAARFTGGVLQLLGDLPGGTDRSVAWSVSADGRVVVGLANYFGTNNAFIWDPESGMRDLRLLLMQRGATQLGAWARLGVQGVSRDGRTVFGTGTAPDGTSHGWVATLAPCGYANCDGSTAAPELNIGDFGCFLASYAAGCPDPAACYANCDGSTAAPFLNVADFGCFLQRYAEGCRTP